MQKYTFHIVILGLFLGLVLGSQFGLFNLYIQSVLMLMGINIMLSVSLNLINGSMGEFSCGHAAFMLVGAYVASILTVWLFTNDAVFGPALLPPSSALFLFPVVVLVAGAAAAVAGLLVAIPSFKTRGDYLAIITIAANYIFISVVENINAIGGSRGFMGMKRVVNAMNDVADIPWMVIWVFVGMFFGIWLIRRYISSTYGKGCIAICQDEVAAEIMSVNTNKIKLVTFMLSSGVAGVAGALFAHQYGYVNPQSFNIMKSTECMVMVYLGGMGSLSGAVMSAVVFTVLMEALRFVLQWLGISQVIKWVLIPLILVLIMQFRPEGIMGNRELDDYFPRLRKFFTFK